MAKQIRIESSKRVLVVWEEIPENTKLYILDGVSELQMKHLVGAHGTFINSTENEHTEWLNKHLEGLDPVCNMDEGDQALKTGADLSLNFDAVIVSGFIL